MIIDAHYHLDPRMQSVENLLEEMNRSHVDRVCLIGAMTDPLPWGPLLDAGTAAMRNLLLGPHPLVRKGRQIYSSLVTPDGCFVAGRKRFLIDYAPNNATVAQAIKENPDRFWGWVFINPGSSDPLTELAKWTGPEWIGVKAHPFMHRYPVSALDSVAGFCIENKYPLLIHLGGDPERGNYAYLPDKYPELKIIYAHAGIPFFRELWEYVKGKENVLVDFSSPAYVDDRIESAAVKVLGAERCLYGTDGPYCDVTHREMIERINRLPLSQLEKECILGTNFLRLTSPQTL